MKNFLKKALRLFIAFLSALFDGFKWMTKSTFIFSAVVIILPLLIPVLPLIIWLVMRYNYKIEKIHSADTTKTETAFKPANSYNYE